MIPAGSTGESTMTVEKLSRIDPGWTAYHGFESPLLQDWAASGPFGARLLGFSLPKVELAPEPHVGALASRLEGRPFDHIEGDAPLARRLSERAPDRTLMTRGDESRRLERTRLALSDQRFDDERMLRMLRYERRAA